MIEVGSKVMCIHDGFPIQIYDWASNIPRHGVIYTVREMSQRPHAITRVLGMAVVLVELDNPLPKGGQMGFSLWRFIEPPPKGEIGNHHAIQLTIPVVEADAATCLWMPAS